MPPKKKGGKDAKGKGKEPEGDPPEEILRKFLKNYDNSCKRIGTTPAPSLTRKVKELMEKEDLSSPSFPVVVSDPVGAQGVQALLDTLREEKDMTIQTLCFWRASIGDEGCAVIAEYLKSDCKLKSLEILDSGITFRGISELGRVLESNETLASLSLDHNDLSDEGATVLSTSLAWNNTLSSLSLEYCGINGAGCEAIANNVVARTKLKSLNLQGNNVGPRGVAALAEALKKSEAIMSLNLADNNFGHDAACVTALREGILANNSLSSVNLHLNNIVPEASALLTEVLKTKRNIVDFKIYERMAADIYKELLDAAGANADANKPKKGKKGKKKK